MKNYLKLVNFEFNRVAKLFVVLLGITFVVQMLGVFFEAKKYLDMANQQIYEEMVPKAQFLQMYGQMSFMEVVRSAWFLAPIALCVAGVAFYIFLIWYRDWVGKNTFIYRLLMLPTTRLNIFYAKITTILVMTFGLVAFQIILLPIEKWIFNGMIPIEFRNDMGLIEVVTSMPELSLIIPNSLLQLVLYYGAGLLAVSILFTGILLERSFKWKGIFAGLLYGAIAVVVFISPLLLQDFVLDGFFYPIELFMIEIVMGLILLVASIWLSGFLLKKKITV
ncbi:hypothetical protein GH741_07350 [Aquibacillus halophilus]|uniref:Uncharacterized protein n=1 Tax=Aquibacillus halophilus TaxID=930132 RepID=A0A6A8DF71_9BACI|nr:hypothetical protein [Aquibacillus halophilus]MRH42499.1 hypothetical protein [Aquibacillus halophilus]